MNSCTRRVVQVWSLFWFGKATTRIEYWAEMLVHRNGCRRTVWWDAGLIRTEVTAKTRIEGWTNQTKLATWQAWLHRVFNELCQKGLITLSSCQPLSLFLEKVTTKGVILPYTDIQTATGILHAVLEQSDRTSHLWTFNLIFFCLVWHLMSIIVGGDLMDLMRSKQDAQEC